MNDSHKRKISALVSKFKSLGIQDVVGFDRLHEYSIITHSTAIEGSTVTFEENELMFDNGIVPAGKTVHEQMMNLDLKHAYDMGRDVARSHTPITPALLKGLSAIVMRNTGKLYRTSNGDFDESRGEFRLLNVSAGQGGRSYLNWQKVIPRTNEFCDWLNLELSNIDQLAPEDVYQLSFEAHYRLVTIHPWSDGNGRMSRLLMNIIQMEGSVVPSYVRSDVRADYIASLRASRDARSSAPFCDFMFEEAIINLQAEIEEYQKSIEDDVPWT